MHTATEVFRRHRELGVPDLVECPACRFRSGPSLRDFEPIWPPAWFAWGAQDLRGRSSLAGSDLLLARFIR
jgi:hypothetical protein